MVAVHILQVTMKTSRRFGYLILLLSGIMVLISSCNKDEDISSVLIAISKGKPDKYYGAYTEWLKSADSTVNVVDLYHLPLDSAMAMLDKCSGLLLTGGPDIHPGFYGRPQDTALCNDGIDGRRDSLELMIIGRALESDIPVLGICRGLQVLNVALGGTLYADIPSSVQSDIKHRCVDKNDCFHDITVIEGSKLYQISQQLHGKVNSNHHQGISSIADNLKAIAMTADGIIEAIQWEYPDNKAFLLAVQWHPERMEYSDPCSLPIALSFIQAAYKAEQIKKVARR
jgi:putative glutamine amidotransferase